MNWHFKKNSETDEIIEVGYSYEKNNACDGVIVYNKSTREPSLKVLSVGSSAATAQRAFQFVCSLIKNNCLTENVFNVRTG